MTTPFVDSHCHLGFPELDSQCDQIVARAKSAGLVRILSVATSFEEFPMLQKQIAKYADVYGAIGVHPHEAKRGVTLGDLIKASQEPKIVALGEAGLDYFYNHSAPEVQQDVFRTHLQACIETEMPVIVHTRNAETDTIQILREAKEGKGGERLRGVIHCYSSDRSLAEYALSIGFYISFSGMLTFKKSEEIRNVAKDVPLERLLVETDSPFLAPLPYRGKTCEPSYVVETAKVLAELKGISFDHIGKQTTENFFSLFTKVPRL